MVAEPCVESVVMVELPLRKVIPLKPKFSVEPPDPARSLNVPPLRTKPGSLGRRSPKEGLPAVSSSVKVAPVLTVIPVGWSVSNSPLLFKTRVPPLTVRLPVKVLFDWRNNVLVPENKVKLLLPEGGL